MASSLNDYQIKGPAWAEGCENGCKYGLVVAPDILPMLMLNEQRAVQMDEGLIEFCTCKAGHMYRQYLRKVLKEMKVETRRNIYAHVTAARVPTIHYEAEAA
jgi:hypothetical protein